MQRTLAIVFRDQLFATVEALQINQVELPVSFQVPRLLATPLSPPNRHPTPLSPPNRHPSSCSSPPPVPHRRLLTAKLTPTFCPSAPPPHTRMPLLLLPRLSVVIGSSLRFLIATQLSWLHSLIRVLPCFLPCRTQFSSPYPPSRTSRAARGSRITCKLLSRLNAWLLIRCISHGHQTVPHTYVHVLTRARTYVLTHVCTHARMYSRTYVHTFSHFSCHSPCASLPPTVCLLPLASYHLPPPFHSPLHSRLHCLSCHACFCTVYFRRRRTGLSSGRTGRRTRSRSRRVVSSTR